MTQQKRPRTAVVTGANGYIGNAVARAFARAGWLTFGLVRSTSGAHALAVEEILPITGSIDDVGSHSNIQSQLPAQIDVIVSVTEDHSDYVRHHNNIIALLRVISSASSANGVTPLVIYTSGCKDYGIGPHFGDDPKLAPHTEDSPLKPPALLSLRAEYAQKILEHKDDFSAVLVRPTNVHGRSSSFYGFFFDVASKAAEADGALQIPSQPNTICHCVHVDDCGDAYVAIASHPDRKAIDGQVFNISAREHETVDQIGQALVSEYGIGKGLEYVEVGLAKRPWPFLLVDFPQWTSSEKLRTVTGWSDHRPLFTEALTVYRAAYEAAKGDGHENIKKVAAFSSKFQ